MRSPVFGLTIILIQHPSRLQLARGVLDVEVLCLLRNSSLPRERYVNTALVLVLKHVHNKYIRPEAFTATDSDKLFLCDHLHQLRLSMKCFRGILCLCPQDMTGLTFLFMMYIHEGLCDRFWFQFDMAYLPRKCYS